MKLTAKRNIKYGATKDEKGNDRVPETAAPGEAFEVSQAVAKQLIELGAAEIAEPAKLTGRDSGKDKD